MLNYSNPYDVLSENISFENVQLMGEMITLKTLRTRYAYARKALDWLYVGLVKDLNRGNDAEHVFSDAYDLVQNAICFLCEFVGKRLTDIYMIKNGQEITIKQATYSLVSRLIDRMRRHFDRSCDIEFCAEDLSVEIDHYKEIKNMATTFKKVFIANGLAAHVIKKESGKNSYCYEIRYRANGYCIITSSTNLQKAKEKFLAKTTPTEINKYYVGKINKVEDCRTLKEFALFFFEKHRKEKVTAQTYKCDLNRINYMICVQPFTHVATNTEFLSPQEMSSSDIRAVH